MILVEIIVDEWIVHYMSNSENRGKIFQFLRKLLEKCDRFVTIRGEGLDQKIWKMAKRSAYWSPESRNLVKWFMANFRTNSKKFLIIEESETVPLSPDLNQKTPSDDKYLVKAALTTGGCILTTDSKLKEILSDWKELKVYMADEFIDQYDC